VDVKLADDRADDLFAQGDPAWELWELLRSIKPRPQDKKHLGPSRPASCRHASARA
jgi:hypothetical protein